MHKRTLVLGLVLIVFMGLFLTPVATADAPTKCPTSDRPGPEGSGGGCPDHLHDNASWHRHHSSHENGDSDGPDNMNAYLSALAVWKLLIVVLFSLLVLTLVVITIIALAAPRRPNTAELIKEFLKTFDDPEVQRMIASLQGETEDSQEKDDFKHFGVSKEEGDSDE